MSKLKTDIKAALANENLKGALGRFADAYVGSREKVYRNKDFNSLRLEIAAIKKYAAENMEALAEKFAAGAARHGAVVFRAKTGAEAVEYISRLAVSRGVKTIVKSKSMATEEIHLNKHLAEHGLEVVETDLGEWIIQLSGQRPSHMVMPAIHMTRGEVADVFTVETGSAVPADIPRLVRVARENLRHKFLSAQMGISGANIAVAESGSLVMCTNEGNGRLVTTLPPLHVAVVGLEKLVANFQDVAPILEALPRSATGQQLTSYLTVLTGPAEAVDETGKPVQKEMHIVLLDNGRTAMRNDPVFREAMQCIRCASCLNVCPVFQLLGGHVYGHVYTGGIGSILTAFFDGMESARDLQALCLGCGRCREVCPGSIDLPALIAEQGRRIAAKEGLPAGKKLFLERVLSNRKLFHGLLRAASRLQKPLTGGRPLIRHLPFFLSGLTEGRSLPAIAEKPLRDRPEAFSGGTADSGAAAGLKIAFFAGCLVDFVYPGIGESAARVLTRLAASVTFPTGQTCCGYPAITMGAPEVAAKLARQNIAALLEGAPDYVVTPCPTCTTALKKEYPALLKDDPEWSLKAKGLAEKVYDFSSQAVRLSSSANRPAVGALAAGKPAGMLTYHDSCHLKRGLGVWEEPRAILRAAGAEIVEMAWPDRCCGFAGSYSLKFPELSRQILEQKLKCIENTKAPLVAVDCPGCLLHIAGGIDQTGLDTAVLHTAQVLDQARPDPR